MSGEFEWMVYSIENFFSRNNLFLQFYNLFSAVLQFFSLVEKINSHEKKKKKTGRRESFRNKTYIFFGNDIFFHSDF